MYSWPLIPHLSRTLLCSEDEESKADEYWKQFATVTATPRVLSHKRPVKL